MDSLSAMSMSCIELPKPTVEELSEALRRKTAVDAKRIIDLKAAVLQLASLGCQCSHECSKDNPGLYCRRVKAIFNILEREAA